MLLPEVGIRVVRPLPLKTYSPATVGGWYKEGSKGIGTAGAEYLRFPL